MNVASPSRSAQPASHVARSRLVSSRGRPPPPSSALISGFVRFRRPGSAPQQIKPVPADRAAASSGSWYRLRTGTVLGLEPARMATITPPDRRATSLPRTSRRSPRISPAPAPRQTSPAARIRRPVAGCASASARYPPISAGLYGALARSRGSGRSAGYRCGTTRRPMNRRLVRSVRRATGDRPGAHRVNRSAAGGCSTVSGTGSIPGPSA